MIDRETVGSLAFLLFLGGAVVVGILGISVLRRLGEVPAKEPGEAGARINPGCVLMMVLVVGIAFFSTALPSVALLPVAFFSVRGVRAFGQGGLGRDAGSVFLLIAFTWLFLMIFQAAMALWEDSIVGAPIRIDLYLSLPVITLVSLLGEAIQASLDKAELAGA